MYLAQNIKKLRKQKGLSQQAFSSDLGVSTGAVGNWETSNREPDLKTIVKLAKYFGVTLDDLVLKDLTPLPPLYAINIMRLRQRNGLTQEDMAKLLGYKGKQGYNAIETGKTKPSIDVLEKLADFFGVTLDQLVKQDLAEGGF